MAIYNEILVGRFARGLQKLFGIKGSVPAKQLSGEVMPMHPLLNGAENRYLEGWSRFMNGANLAGSAGNVNGVRLRNPATSNVVVVFEKLGLNNPSASAYAITLSFGPSTTDLPSPFAQTGARLDNRGNPSPSLVASFTQVPAITALASSFLVGNVAVNAFYDFIGTDIQEITLLPGDAIQIQSNVVNLQSMWTWMWRERFLEESERT